MKLSTKNSIIFLVVTLCVFCLGAYIFYVQLQDIIDEEAQEELFQLKQDVNRFVEKNKRFPESVNAMTLLSFEGVETSGTERTLDTLHYIKAMDEVLPFKQIIFYTKLNDQNYKVSIGKAMFESEDLIETIVTSFIILAGVLILVLIVVNYVYSKFMWKPFFKTLDAISKYDIEKDGTVAYAKSSTLEFDRFSAAVNKMTAKLMADYQNLRAFTENASHELQTPIAVMITKTEDLLQSDNLNEEQKKQIYIINQTAVRLKKLNQTLLLLSKIENAQFKVKGETDISERLKFKLEQFEDLIKIKNIKLSSSIKEKVSRTMDPTLVDTVISNLLGNAIKYTEQGNEIRIKLDEHVLSVSNTGKPFLVDPEKLFERFFKLNQDSDSNGLGLALVKQISNTYGHNIRYEYRENMHIFEYIF